MQIAFFGARIVLNVRRECIIPCTPSWRQKAARHPTRPRGASAGGEREREIDRRADTNLSLVDFAPAGERHREQKGN